MSPEGSTYRLQLLRAFGVRIGMTFALSQRGERAVLLAVLVPVLTANAACGIWTLRLASQRTRIKEDFAHVNSLRNGLLSVDVWKGHLQNIVTDRITHLRFTPEQEAALRTELENVL